MSRFAFVVFVSFAAAACHASCADSETQQEIADTGPVLGAARPVPRARPRTITQPLPALQRPADSAGAPNPNAE